MSRYNSRLVSVLIIAAVTCGALLLYAKLAGMYEEYAYPRMYSEQVTKSAQEYSVPEYIVYAVIRTESSFVERAVSSKGAVGLMQIMPETFTWLLDKTGDSVPSEELYKPDINIKYGTCLLSMLYGEYGDWNTAYAAYNAGRAKVQSWLDDPTVTKNGKLHNIPYKETAEYIKRVSNAASVYKRLYYKK